MALLVLVVMQVEVIMDHLQYFQLLHLLVVVLVVDGIILLMLVDQVEVEDFTQRQLPQLVQEIHLQ